jgi:rhamnulokinase
VITKFGLPDIFPRLVEPGTKLGVLRESIQKQTGLGPVPVIATCGHDTSAVAAAVPGYGDRWAFLSCGTWSILGEFRDSPVVTPECHKYAFCNEYAMGGWFVCRNILGLWLEQELRRKWSTTEDTWDFMRVEKAAAEAVTDALINVSDDTLLAPADMEAALQDALVRLGQPTVSSRGELARCVVDSLAAEYAYRIDLLAELTGERADALFIVGGGSRNALLCQMTANACGLPVHAGVDQCTAVGNAMTQAVGLGVLSGPEEVREVMRNSFALTTYEPRDADIWASKLDMYRGFQNV